VMETYRHDHDGDVVAATVAGEVIESTGHHPWWVVRGENLKDRPQPEHVPFNPDGYSGEGRWVDAIDLRAGDVLLLRSGEEAAITSLVVRHARLPVYNFHVEELHCYAVGHAQVLVHNNSLDELAAKLRNGQIKDKDLRKLGLSAEDISYVREQAKATRIRQHDAAKIIDDITGSEKAVQNALEKVRRSPADPAALRELEEATAQLDAIKKAQDELRRRGSGGN
jgi:hypothetical protein